MSKLKEFSANKDMLNIVRKCCMLGLTDGQIADVLGMETKAYAKRRETDPNLQTAASEGRRQASANVAHALYKRAIGYSHVAYKIFCYEGHIKTKRYVEHYPPDTVACIFWLKNREPELWADVQKITGKITVDEIGDQEAARRVAFVLAEQVINKASGQKQLTSEVETQDAGGDEGS